MTLSYEGLPLLLDRLTPVDGRQQSRWRRMRAPIKDLHRVLWSASAGFELTPAIDACAEGRAPAEVKESLQPDFLHVMSDYGAAPLARLLDLAKAGRSVKIHACTLDAGGSRDSSCSRSGPEIVLGNFIRLSLFTPSEVKRLRLSHPHFHESVTISSIPDDTVHFVAFDVTVPGPRDGVAFPVLYATLENEVVWEQVFARHRIRVDVLCALRIGGKSGSVRDLDKQLLAAIRSSDPSIQPGYVVRDDGAGVPASWPVKGSHPGGYSTQSYYEADWRGGARG